MFNTKNILELIDKSKQSLSPTDIANIIKTNKYVKKSNSNNNKIQKHNFILIRAQQKINIYYTGKIDTKITIE